MQHNRTRRTPLRGSKRGVAANPHPAPSAPLGRAALANVARFLAADDVALDARGILRWQDGAAFDAAWAD